MRQRFQSRKLRFLAVLVAAVCLAGGAFAYFTASGSGTAQAQVGSADAVTFRPGSPSVDLFPEGTADVDVLVDNPNAFSVHLNSLVLKTTEGTGGFAVETGDSSCDMSELHFPVLQTNGGAGWDVPASASGWEIHLADGAISMDADAPNSCQGDRFKVYLQAGS